MSETIGLDIGSHSIKLVDLKMTSKGPFLTCVGIKEIPPGKNKEDVNTVSEILRTLVGEVGLKTKKVSLTVSGSGVNIQRISVPFIPKAELKEAVRWEIKGQLPFPVETARIEFHLLGELMEDGVRKLDLVVVACPNPLIEQTLSIAKNAGLEPIHLDVGPFALWNTLLTWDQFKKEENIALIDLGSEKTGIHLFKDGILQFSREVTPAGADITRAIVEGLVGGEGSDPVAQQAERIKQEVGIPSEADSEKRVEVSLDGEMKSIHLSKISYLIRPVLERTAAEIRRSIDYYRSQFGEERIDKLLLTGGGANLKNISSHLANELRLPVERFNPLEGFLFDSKKVDRGLVDQMGSTFAIASGVALGEPNRIELLPVKEPLTSRLHVGRWVPILAPALTVLIFLGIIWSMNSQISSLQKERGEKTAKAQNLEALQTKLTSLKERERLMKQEISLFPTPEAVSIPYEEVLGEMSRLMPGNVTLKFLSAQSRPKPTRKESEAQKPSEGVPPKEEKPKLLLTGLAFGSDLSCLTAIAQIMERFEKSPFLGSAKLLSASENKSYTLAGTEFKIGVDIALPGPRREEKD